MDADDITAADLRAELARLNLPRYIVAAGVGVHPSRLSAVLCERDQLPKGMAKALLAFIEKHRQAQGASQ